ncbi:tRNA (guanosine(37)-N1)-methyltransferase TrmD [Candidatus Kuenenbacteria bacterium HGW-Kuenenbacteria-1]|uniref:tRNA (guanine-N(1)-)-methyltransferase n=1 Tax=Candidatus Kuenenbacteria bacterium HGW-Kuenenbacteria-1 TaxID=2013812 RepID=A0A2N1UP56_9BACT|nr:MAG: tRNA (guanosine(37)-N1)-methyltransferase TrmD [Candidatus Kuenenbacteria bacterium HGW-Kuenenbacteria-1]
MIFNILTIFPQIFNSYFNESIIKRAQKEKIIEINFLNIRDCTIDKHKTVDDTPYGGGIGMLMKIEPIYQTLKNFKLKHKTPKQKIILLTPKGKKFNQRMAERLSQLNQITFICGRYEGIDERVNKLIDEKISIGDYILTGGEIPAMAIVDAITRLLPGVLGKDESSKVETFSKEGFLEYPQYTRPEIFEINGKKARVPKILLSGNHKKIQEWQEKKTIKI